MKNLFARLGRVAPSLLAAATLSVATSEATLTFSGKLTAVHDSDSLTDFEVGDEFFASIIFDENVLRNVDLDPSPNVGNFDLSEVGWSHLVISIPSRDFEAWTYPELNPSLHVSNGPFDSIWADGEGDYVYPAFSLLDSTGTALDGDIPPPVSPASDWDSGSMWVGIDAGWFGEMIMLQGIVVGTRSNPVPDSGASSAVLSLAAAVIVIARRIGATVDPAS